MNAAEIIAGFDKAHSDRTVISATWEDLIYFTVPRKRGITATYEPGEKPSSDVYDDTAIQSNLFLAAALSGYMTNATQRWFELRCRDEKTMDNQEVREFFSKSAETMYLTLANSNFYQQIHEVYIDLGSIGTSSIYEDDDAKDGVRFYTRHMKEMYIVEDEREEVNMVYRKFQMTAYQAYGFFGKDKVGEKIVKCVEEQKDFGKKFDFIHYVCPRYKRDTRKIDSKNKPFASYWVSVADKKITREGGYDEFPYFCPRFYKNSGETYGYSPSYTCYPSIIRLNNATECYETGAYQDAYPAWIAENDGLMGTLDLRRDAINYQRQPLSQGQAVQSLRHTRNIQVGIDYMDRQAEKIKKAFFVDLFLMLVQSPNMTATEVIERTNEKMFVLGPVLGRLQSELLNPIIYRTFNILLRKGLLPPVPQALQGQDWDVVYVSPLAKAQRAVQAKDMQTFLAIVAQIAQGGLPEALDKVNVDNIIDKFGKVYSIEPDNIASTEDANAKREQRAQAQAQAQQMQSMMVAAQGAKTAGEATHQFAKAENLKSGK